MNNTAQILLALLGFFGVAWFVLNRLSSPKILKSPHRAARAALLFGLSSWLGLTLLRHDVVATTGLVVALILFWRYFRAGY